MKIKEMYVILNKDNTIKKHYITTFGQASCNLNGCICLDNLVGTLKNLIKSYNTNNEELKRILGIKPFNKDKIRTLEKKEDNLYKSYYDTVFSLLTVEEINKIQKQIEYNFMSDNFINKMIELLESKEV